MDDEKLIECVRKYPVIYDMSHTKYLDNKHKSMIWSSIAEEMKHTEDSCKKRWTNIRDQFKRHLNKRKTKNGQSVLNIKRYKYEESLQFWLPHVRERDTISNIESEKVDDANVIQNESGTDGAANSKTQLLNDVQSLDDPPPFKEFKSVSLQTTIPPPTTYNIRSQNRNHRAMLRSSQSTGSASHALMKYMIENNTKVQKDIHPVDAFFNGLAPTLKNFSPYYQHLAKGRIFAVIQELEWEQLLPQTSTSASSTLTPTLSTLTRTPPLPTKSDSATDNINMVSYFSQYREDNN